jgi:CysZ protein
MRCWLRSRNSRPGAEVDQVGRATSSLAQFRYGVALLGEGGRFIRRERALWALAVVPVVFATLFVVAAAMAFWLHIELIHTTWVSVLPVLHVSDWWNWIWVGPARLLFWLVGWLGLVVAFAFSLIVALLLSNLASAPFLDRLSQRVEMISTGQSTANVGGDGGLISDILRSFAAELQRILLLGSLWGVLTLVGFVLPGAHIVTAPLLVLLTVLFLPLDYAGFALDRRQFSFRSRRQWLSARWPTMAGFGGVAFIACLIPGLNLLIMPALVTAGTLLVLRSETEEPSGAEA